jgi:hypothetical protein
MRNGLTSQLYLPPTTTTHTHTHGTVRSSWLPRSLFRRFRGSALPAVKSWHMYAAAALAALLLAAMAGAAAASFATFAQFGETGSGSFTVNVKRGAGYAVYATASALAVSASVTAAFLAGSDRQKPADTDYASQPLV